MRARVGETAIGVGSALIIAASLFHAGPGWYAMRVGLGEIDARLGIAIGLGWHFGSAAMATFGGLGLWSAYRLRQGDASARVVPAATGALFVVFALFALARGGSAGNFATYFTLGATLIAGTAIWLPASGVADAPVAPVAE